MSDVADLTAAAILAHTNGTRTELLDFLHHETNPTCPANECGAPANWLVTRHHNGTRERLPRHCQTHAHLLTYQYEANYTITEATP